MGNAKVITKRVEILRRRITSCTACRLHLYCQSPVPPLVPPSHLTPEILVIAEAPGAQEDKAGEPLVGPAGKVFFKWLGQELGIHRKQVMAHNTAACRPSVANKMKLNRQPAKDELRACRDHLAATIDLYIAMGGRWILLLGATALGSIVEGAKIGQWSGRPFVITHRSGELLNCISTYHPAAALRDIRNEAPIRQHLKMLGRVRSGDWPDKCMCGKDVDRFDAMGIPWCEEHLVYRKDTCRAPEVKAKQMAMI